jgi:hypothetical protein
MGANERLGKSSRTGVRKAGESQSAKNKAKQKAALEVVQWSYPAL